MIIVAIIIIAVVALIMYIYIRNHIEDQLGSINTFLSRHCENRPILNSEDYQWTQQFRDKWKIIRNEFLNYSNKYLIPSYQEINECASMKTEGWKALFLRIFDNDTEITNEFPETMKLINSCQCTTAYFSKLEPGTKIAPHYGIYKGVIRYHLGIIVPTEWEQCFLKIDNQIMNWKEGEDIMFDDMFEHSVENNTDQPRVVLFLDIKRQFQNPFINLINSILMRFIKSNDTLQNTVTAANSKSKISSSYSDELRTLKS
jgi:beta-hydroxylase